MSATPIATSTATPAHFADAMFEEGDAPQLRTILLTDICDSTGLVEVLGDKGAAQLFREHDRLVMTLQQQWRGRLIDRSDGLLLLFERPIDGLGFAIDYARGLSEIGKLRSIDIKIRAGLHVGEVLTWRNSEESVRVGAKPIEVEGLAKPTAARLMSMARPGQILLSAVAEPLAHRAARELGERGQHLIWKSLGRWRFKGVPEPQEIFEVGEPGIAPLRAPPNSPKAWRAVPLWRRPAMLAAQLALVVAVGIGGWFVTRPAPAIAFGERDWVVVGDLRNLTGQTVLDESLEQAFRISLEQSRHVNVLSDLKTRDTLARMQLPADTVIDRDIASEIALRDGARAVILPTVAEVGGRVRFSAEVIDPASQTTVFAESSDGDGTQSMLVSIDKVTSALRANLGEAFKNISQDSMPLPQATTENIDALRAYALGQRALGSGDYDAALGHFNQATELDPEFALAWMGQVRTHVSDVNAGAALKPLDKALALKHHLPPRERLYLEAWAAEFNEPHQSSVRWIELATLYPDYWAAHGNAAIAMILQNRFDEAIPHAVRNTAPQNDLAAIAFDLLGRAHLAKGEFDSAHRAFSTAVAKGFPDSNRRLAATDAARRRFERAERLLSKLRASDRHAGLDSTAAAIDQGKWREGVAHATRLRDAPGNTPHDTHAATLTLATAQWLAAMPKPGASNAEKVERDAAAAYATSGGLGRVNHAALGLAAAMLRQRIEGKPRQSEFVSEIESDEGLMRIPAVRDLVVVIRADALRLSGQPKRSIELLQPLADGHERYQVRVALLWASIDAKEFEAAREHALWLQKNRGLAYVELGCGQCTQALNVADSNFARKAEALALRRMGDEGEARRVESDFRRDWPEAVDSIYLSAN
ncbi:MAG: hypothetical protein A2190_04095 [Lysobacterales bacterium RIFOXYA1_FULL_69_10]|nr:MAG: hypothetical protein A2190_04095 [Xanthomonadales bacterium RIFOXYA1_FULL_69_10]